MKKFLSLVLAVAITLGALGPAAPRLTAHGLAPHAPASRRFQNNVKRVLKFTLFFREHMLTLKPLPALCS